MRDGWPNHINDPDLTPYWAVRNELTLEGDCILRGIRVAVPPKLRQEVLQELHLSHPGTVPQVFRVDFLCFLVFFVCSESIQLREVPKLARK